MSSGISVRNRATTENMASFVILIVGRLCGATFTTLEDTVLNAPTHELIAVFTQRCECFMLL